MEEMLTKIMVTSLQFEQIKYCLTSFTIPLFDEICRRATNFIHSCLHSDSHVIRSIVLHGIHVSRTYSPIGRNAAFCSLHYDILALTIYSTLNLEVTTVLHVLNPSYLQIYLLVPMLYAKLF